MKKITLLLFLLSSFFSFSQDISMQNGTVSQCSGTLYDSGGEFGNYGNNESFVLTICPPNQGDIIQLDFSLFNTQLNKDKLTIYNGDSTAAPSLGTFSGGSANSPGLKQATVDNGSGCLTLEWVSDGAGNAAGWAAAISCYTPCQMMVASIDSTDPGFDVSNIVVAELDEVVTFNGSGTFTNSGANATYTWDFGDGSTATGQTVSHPFTTAGVYQVSLIITDTNPLGCSSEPVSVVVQVGASGPGNPSIDAGRDVTIPCDEDSIEITAKFLDIGETNTYTVSEIPFVPPFPFNGLSNSISITVDDIWGPAENLPFDFCFFGNTETQFQVGSNGVIRFKVGTYDPSAVKPWGTNAWQFDQNLPNNTTAALSEANIFTPAHDINPAVTGASPEIAWEIIGAAPNRVLAVAFYNVPMYSCTTLLATHMAVFYETTNVIDIYIKDSPTCAFNSYSAVVGIQNHAGTQAFVPPGRNTSNSPWTATNEAWRFTPSGDSVTEFAWLDAAGNVIGTDPTMTVSPTEETTYTARVIYTNCNGDEVTVTDDVTVSVDIPFELDAGPDLEFCEGDADAVINADIGSDTATYQWAKNGIDIVDATNPTFTVISGETGTYTVSVTEDTCTLSDDVVVNYYDMPVANELTEYRLCDDTVVDGFTEFDLSTKSADVIGTQTDVNLSYHISQADADANENPLDDLFTNTVNPQTIFVRLENTNLQACFDTTTLVLNVSSGIELVEPENLVLCASDGATDTAEFDLDSQTAPMLNGVTDITISYHASLNDAQYNLDPLPTDYTNTSSPQTIYVRAQNDLDNLCFTTTTFQLMIAASPTVITPSNLSVCDDNTADGFTAIDLSLKNIEISGGDPNAAVSYYFSLADAQSATDALDIPYTNISNPQTVYVRVQNANTGCYDTTELVLEVEQAPEAFVPTDLDYCDPDSDGFGVFNLNDRDAQITGGAAGVSVTYHETIADANNNVNALVSPYNNIVVNTQTVYARVESATIATSCATIVPLVLNVYPTPQIEAPSALEVCDDVSADGIAQFNLGDKEEEILGGLDPALFSVTFYLDQANANAGTNAILTPNNFTNTTPFNQIIWLRVTADATGCYKVKPLELIVNAIPVLVQPTPLSLCDYNNTGDERESFDLEAANAQILNGQAGITLSYYESQADANLGENPIATPYTNTVNPQTIYVRAENNTTGCSSTITLLIRVDPVPSPAIPAALEVCDIDNDGFGVFDLEARTITIINGELDIAVTYHETLDEANAGQNALSSPYNSIVPNLQTVYARSTNILTGCYAIVPLDLIVSPSPEVPLDIEDYLICDTNNDGFAQFDLTTMNAEILGTQEAANFTLTYHLSEANALSGVNPIVNVNNYTNLVNPQTIYVRLKSVANGCVSIGQFNLVVALPPVAIQPTPLSICDDDIDDEMTSFDLTVKDTEITGGNPNWSVGYYTTSANAQADIERIEPATDYTNMSVNGNAANPQTLFVRVTDINTGCVDFVTLTIRVLPNPSPRPNPRALELCDDTDPGSGQTVFDLTQNQAYIINGEPGMTATYYETLLNAEDAVNPIATPEAYTNTNTNFGPQTIYVRVTNDLTGCYAIVSFTITVNPLPEAGPVSDYIICELNNDGIASFNLQTKNEEALNGQDPAQFTVTYHISEADADAVTNSIVTPFFNSVNPQEIFVAITNNTTGCSVSTESFFVEVQEGAMAYIPDTYVICDNIGANDGYGQFDLSVLDPEVLGNQDPENYTIHYYFSEADAILGENPLPTLYENLTNPQVIYVRVDNDTPTADGADSSICFDVAPISLQVDLLPIYDLADTYVLCEDLNGSEAIGPLVIDTELSADDYSFVWSFNGEIITGETAGSLAISQAGLYDVFVTNLTTGCSLGDSTEVSISTPPSSLQAVVASEAFGSENVIEAEALGSGVYEYSLDNGPWQDSGTFTGVSMGAHVVTARDVNGCGLLSVTVTIMDYPKFFTPNGDGYNDTWNIVGLSDQPSAKIYIFDRFGKLLKQISPAGTGWDGTFNGELMPTSDYWFTVEYDEPITGDRKEFKAHFTLKR